jgi:hypothetical protein
LPADPNERLKLGIQAAVNATNRFAGKKVGSVVLSPLLGAIKIRYGFQTLEVVQQGQNWAVRGQINPVAIAGTRVIIGSDKDTGATTTNTIIETPEVINFEFKRFTDNQSVSTNEVIEGLQHHQSALNSLTIEQWLANIHFRPFFRGKIAKKETNIGRDKLLGDLRKTINDEYKNKNITLSESQLEGLVKIRSRGTHASHSADAISGGNIDSFDSLERGAINSYIGSRWGQKRPALEIYAKNIKNQFDAKDRPQVKMNFKLRPHFLN